MHTPNSESNDPLRPLMAELAAKALGPIADAVGEYAAYEGRVEIHFMNRQNRADPRKHDFQTLTLHIPKRAGIADSLLRVGSDNWHRIGMGICDAIGNNTLYTGRISVRFLDENCNGPLCTHGPVDFVMEIMVIANRAAGSGSPLFNAGMFPQHRHDADGNCIDL